MPLAPITPETRALIELLRSDLEAAHFTDAGIAGLWGPDAAAALRRNERVPALRALRALRTRLGSSTPVATLAELFLLGLPVTESDVASAFPSLGVDGAQHLGLLGHTAPGQGAPFEHGAPSASVIIELPSGEPRLRALLELRPYEFTDSRGSALWWILSDLGELALGGPLGESHVLGVGGASRTLSAMMVQNEVDSALDLGTGCGIQAMHASRHAKRVVATDISHRALELAALNCALNRIDHIELRFGSLFEPVAGEKFDHIISNPPFVITPRVEGVPAYEYRDGGMVGDALVEKVVREAAQHLNSGGVAQLLGNWEYREQGVTAGVSSPDFGSSDTPDSFARLRSWLQASPGHESLDYWIIEREVQSATRYAETWIRDGGTRPGTPDFDRLFAAWLDDFAERGVEQVGFGYMLLRAPIAGATLARIEGMHTPLGDNQWGIGVHIGNCLAAHDWHAAQSDQEFAEQCLVVAGDVTEERHYWPGHDDPTELLLRQGGGFARTIAPGTALAALVGASDGELSIAAIAAALAQLLEVDESALRAELIDGARRLLDDGILLPPSA